MNEHGPKKELRDVRVLRHKFTMSSYLEEAVKGLFEPGPRPIKLIGAYATRELVLDEIEYSHQRYYDFIRHNQQEFQEYSRIFHLGRSDSGPIISLNENEAGVKVGLRIREQTAFNALIEAMNTQALVADPHLAPYNDARPPSGSHYLTLEARGGRLVERNELRARIGRLSFESMSLERRSLYTVHPKEIGQMPEIRLVVPHPPYSASDELGEITFGNEVAL